MSELKVNKISPRSGTDVTLGDSGDTFTVPSGATLDASNATLTLPDDSVTAAKLDSTAVDNTNTNSTVITGQTAETSIDGADSILIYDDSATALRKMTRTNFVAGIGGTNTPAFKATKNTTTSLTANTYTKVPFNNEIFDTDSCYDNVTNYRFTPNVAGKYLIYGHLWSYMQSTAAQSSQFRTSLYKNGAEDFTATVLQGTSGNNIQQENAINIVSIQEANGTTDYFEIYVRVSDNNATMYQGEFGAYKIIE
jgi:hypothetical protein